MGIADQGDGDRPAVQAGIQPPAEADRHAAGFQAVPAADHHRRAARMIPQVTQLAGHGSADPEGQAAGHKGIHNALTGGFPREFRQATGAGRQGQPGGHAGAYRHHCESGRRQGTTAQTADGSAETHRIGPAGLKIIGRVEGQPAAADQQAPRHLSVRPLQAEAFAGADGGGIEGFTEQQADAAVIHKRPLARWPQTHHPETIGGRDGGTTHAEGAADLFVAGVAQHQLVQGSGHQGLAGREVQGAAAGHR